MGDVIHVPHTIVRRADGLVAVGAEGSNTEHGWRNRAREHPSDPIAPLVVAWIDANPQPVTLEHREGEYVHFKCDANTHYQFVDGAWRNPDYPRVPVTVREIEDWNARLGVTAHGFLAPGTITKATPAEPTTFGYVGVVTDERGGVWDVSHSSVMGAGYVLVSREVPDNWSWRNWPDVLALGTFEAVER